MRPTSDAVDTVDWKTNARAVVDGEQVVIRLAIASLQHIVDGGADAIGEALYVSDAQAFAEELCAALNNESEDGSTPVYRMIDAAVLAAWEAGALGVELVDDGAP